MRKILSSLFLLLNMSLYSQSIVTVTHDSRLTETLWDFEKHMKEVDFDKSNITLILNIRIVTDYWLYKTYGSPCWALTRQFENGKYVVYIGDSAFKYKPVILNAIMYHEMFHVLAKVKDHCDGALCPKLINGETLNVKDLENTWDSKKKIELLKYIKWNQDIN